MVIDVDSPKDFDKWFSNQGKTAKESLDNLTIYKSPIKKFVKK